MCVCLGSHVWVWEVTLTADWPDGSLAVGATRENCPINLSGLPSPRDACFGVYCNTFMSPTVT